MARPLGSLLTVMGRKTIPLYSANSDLEARILAGLRVEPSPLHRETDLSFYLGKNQGLPDLGKNLGKNQGFLLPSKNLG